MIEKSTHQLSGAMLGLTIPAYTNHGPSTKTNTYIRSIFSQDTVTCTPSGYDSTPYQGILPYATDFPCLSIDFSTPYLHLGFISSDTPLSIESIALSDIEIILS